ncbi:MAG: capsular polysaccharide transport system permease protein [Alphaproteobacteria bacterium]|nr:capsular polysaccharide transport system permease protein [Alphaproteobacteria bacterium]
MNNEPKPEPGNTRPGPVGEKPAIADAERVARRRERAAARAQAHSESAGLPQSLIDQLPAMRRERPTVVSATGRIEQRLTVTPLRQVPRSDETVDGQILKVRRNYGEKIWFVLSVVLPVAVATVYLAFFASNQYVAEFRFAVKDATTQSATAATSSLISAIGGSGGSVAYDNYLVADYLLSRQATEELQQRINVTQLFGRREADWWARFDPSQPMEKFVGYWQSMVTAHYDQVTGIAIARVRAFTPEDALLIANSLVTMSEELVNRIANRAQNDAVRFAQREVERAEERLKAIRAKLTEYRNRVGVIDPASSVVASNSALVQGLRANLAQLETHLQTLRLQNLQPNAPAVITLLNQINSTKEQLATIEGSVGRNKSGAALSAVIAEYEQLDLERQFAQTMVTSTMAALDTARASAASQHLYITPYVRPSLPESSVYPRRLLTIGTVAGLGLIVWLIGLLVGRSAFERLG